MFTIEFISLTESFSCPLFEENLMIQQYHFTHILMKHLCFGLVTDLLILVSGYREFCKFILKRFLFNPFYLSDILLLVNVRVCNVFLRLIINIKKKKKLRTLYPFIKTFANSFFDIILIFSDLIYFIFNQYMF